MSSIPTTQPGISSAQRQGASQTTSRKGTPIVTAQPLRFGADKVTFGAAATPPKAEKPEPLWKTILYWPARALISAWKYITSFFTPSAKATPPDVKVKSAEPVQKPASANGPAAQEDTESAQLLEKVDKFEQDFQNTYALMEKVLGTLNNEDFGNILQTHLQSKLQQPELDLILPDDNAQTLPPSLELLVIDWMQLDRLAELQHEIQQREEQQGDLVDTQYKLLLKEGVAEFEKVIANMKKCVADPAACVSRLAEMVATTIHHNVEVLKGAGLDNAYLGRPVVNKGDIRPLLSLRSLVHSYSPQAIASPELAPLYQQFKALLPQDSSDAKLTETSPQVLLSRRVAELIRKASQDSAGQIEKAVIASFWSEDPHAVIKAQLPAVFSDVLAFSEKGTFEELMDKTLPAGLHAIFREALQGLIAEREAAKAPPPASDGSAKEASDP